MATVAFSALSPEVLATAPTCPIPTVIRHVRNAARDLCERAKCYRVRIEDEPVASGEADFQFYVPDDTVLVAPISLTINECRLDPSSPQLLNEDDPDWRTTTGQPTHFIRAPDDVNGIRLYPTPDQAYNDPGIYGEIAVKPSRDATAIDEIILERYQDAIIEGALARLLMIRNTAWYAPQLASAHAAAFESMVNDARGHASGDDMPKRRTVKYGGL